MSDDAGWMLSTPPPLPSEPAGFTVRLMAHVIDSVIWTVLMTLVAFSFFGKEIMAAVAKAAEQSSGGTVAIDPHLFEPPLWFTLIFNYALPIAVLLVLWKWKSATPGKMMMGVKVVDAETKGPLKMSQCILRMIGYIPPMIPLMFLMLTMVAPQPMLFFGAAVFTCPLLWTFLSVLTDPLKRGWHDRLAGTMVVKG